MIESHFQSFIADESGRLDVVVSKKLEIPRTIFSLDDTSMTINGIKAKKSSKVKIGDQVRVEWKESFFEGLEKSEVDLNEVYEDDDILVIDKKQGLVVHPGTGVHDNTVVNGLLYKYGDDFSLPFDDTRPGIVHRLDKDTSGLMVIAKNSDALRDLQAQFMAHSVKKTYYAIVKGDFAENRGRIEKRIERDRRDRKKFKVTDSAVRGKEAITEYRVISSKGGYSFLEVNLLTGRTHQIRVHLSSIHHPVLGDPIYSNKDKNFPDSTLMLHSGKLEIVHPRTKEKMLFASPLPVRMQNILRELGIVYEISD